MNNNNLENFTSSKEMGDFFKNKRVSLNEDLDGVAKKLFIKKRYLEIIEAGDLSTLDIKNTYIIGFIRSYANYLNININIDIKKLTNMNDEKKIKDSKVPLEIIPPKEKVSGSLIILFSILLLGLVYLLWQKQDYYNLHNLEKTSSSSSVLISKTLKRYYKIKLEC